MRAELIRVRMYALGQLVLEPLSVDFAPLAAAWDTFLADAVDTGSVVVRSTGASSSAAASASASSGLAPARRRGRGRPGVDRIHVARDPGLPAGVRAAEDGREQEQLADPVLAAPGRPHLALEGGQRGGAAGGGLAAGRLARGQRADDGTGDG